MLLMRQLTQRARGLVPGISEIPCYGGYENSFMILNIAGILESSVVRQFGEKFKSLRVHGLK